MKALSRNTVWTLIGKDWQLNRNSLLAFVAAGGLALVLLALPSFASFYVGAIGLITVLVAVGAQLVFATVLYERRDQTLAFVMTLPVSAREYVWAKLGGNLLIFAALWLLLLVATTVLILLRDTLPDGLLPYAWVLLVQLLFGYVLMLLAAVWSESQGWTIAALVLGNLLLQGLMYALPNVFGLAEAIKADALTWSPVYTATLLLQGALMLALLGLTVRHYARRRDWV